MPSSITPSESFHCVGISAQCDVAAIINTTQDQLTYMYQSPNGFAADWQALGLTGISQNSIAKAGFTAAAVGSQKALSEAIIYVYKYEDLGWMGVAFLAVEVEGSQLTQV